MRLRVRFFVCHNRRKSRRRVEVVGVDFTPHDARRTLLTHALAAGSNVRDMQFISGYAKAETTMRYAIVKDANEVRRRVKLGY